MRDFFKSTETNGEVLRAAEKGKTIKELSPNLNSLDLLSETGDNW